MADMEYRNGALCLDKMNVSDNETYSIDDTEWINLVLDSSNHIIEGTKTNGKKYFPCGIDGMDKLIKNINITIGNSSKIGVFSTSFTHGYCMRNHHLLNNLSMFSDYIFYNYGKSGSTPPETLTRINNNEPWLGDTPVQEWNIDYGVIIFEENDGLIYSKSVDAYNQIYEKLANAIKDLGGIPMFATEHDYHGGDFPYYTQQRLCNRYGYIFMDNIRRSTSLFGGLNGQFQPFWNSNHPATRTHWLWTNTMLPYIQNLPRPTQGIKIFKVRNSVDTSDILNLMYNTIYERANKFLEIDCGASALTQETEKYFDRLNEKDANNQFVAKYVTINDSYQKLQSHTGNVQIGNFGIIECITPYTSNNIFSMSMNLIGSGIEKVYVRKNISAENFLEYERMIGFGVSSGFENLSIGQTFTITGGTFDPRLHGTYTITGFVDNSYITTDRIFSWEEVSGTDNIECTLQNATLKGSYRSPNADFFNMVDKPFGDWVELNETNGIFEIPSEILNKCIDFDKASFLLQGTNITISDISFNVSGCGQKNKSNNNVVLVAKDGTELLSDTLLDDNTSWINIESISKYVPVIDPINHNPELLPIGVNVVRELNPGDVLSQTIDTSTLNKDPYKTSRLQVRIVARYFPLYVDTDEKWLTSEITEDSFDCTTINVCLNDFQFATFVVGAYWNEYIAELDYLGGTTLNVKCVDKKVQICKVELIYIGEK